MSRLLRKATPWRAWLDPAVAPLVGAVACGSSMGIWFCLRNTFWCADTGGSFACAPFHPRRNELPLHKRRGVRTASPRRATQATLRGLSSTRGTRPRPRPSSTYSSALDRKVAPASTRTTGPKEAVSAQTDTTIPAYQIILTNLLRRQTHSSRAKRGSMTA